METPDPDERLADISTWWSLVARAHQPVGAQSSQSRHLLVDRYSGAVRRYLLGSVPDAEAREDLFQEFCLRLLRGDFRNADPGRGRFRDLLKTALINLVRDHHRVRLNRPQGLPDDLPDRSEAFAVPLSDEQFLEDWRQEILRNAWLELANVEKQTGLPYHTVLRLRADFPLLSTAELADRLQPRLGRVLSADALRQLLHRTRDRFADLLLREVACSLGAEASGGLEDELIHLGLFDYCRAALARRAG
jgi:RNA polymerase sigma-70 factor (ECF subfamily)